MPTLIHFFLFRASGEHLPAIASMFFAWESARPLPPGGADANRTCKTWAALALLEAFHPSAGAVFIFLGRAATNPASAYQHTAAEDRHGTLAEKHVVTLGHDNTPQRRMVGAWRELAAGTAKRGRSYSLALATIGTRPHGPIHPLKCQQSTASITHGDVHLGADLCCLGNRTRNHAVR